MHLRVAISSKANLNKIENKKNYFIIIRKEFEKINLKKISDGLQTEEIEKIYKNLKHNDKYIDLVDEESHNFLTVNLILKIRTYFFKGFRESLVCRKN